MLILWNTRVPIRRKLVLILIFSASVIVMVVSIIRVTVVQSGHQSVELAWLFFWSYVEVGTGEPSCRDRTCRAQANLPQQL